MARSVHSVMSHAFSDAPNARVKRSTFNRSHGLKTTFNDGDLVPVFLDEVLPGDTFDLKETYVCRLSTPIYPIMDNMTLDTQYFFVPCRLLWQHWENFCGTKDSPGDTTEYVIPTLQLQSGEGLYFQQGGIVDHFGIPPLNDSPAATSYVDVNALPFRAYNLIWNEYYRDENLQDPVPTHFEYDSGESTSDFSILKRGKRYDYFTSALPWPQKGPAVSIPLQSSAPVTGLPGPTGVVADTSALGGTINQLRQAFQIQKMLERDARGGTRYIEILRSHFGVSSPDARLQRPEYLGGTSSYVNISPIAQTSSTDSTSPQGNLGAVATVTSSKSVFTRTFVEHGYVIGLASVSGDLNYQQGLDRIWTRKTRYDFYWPSLAHLGEQAVLNKEIYLKGYSLNSSGEKVPIGVSGQTDEDVFGYQERYAEYRYKPSRISNYFRSVLFGAASGGSLDAWHLAQSFSNLPVLNKEFIQVDLPLERVLAVSPSQVSPFLMDAWFDLRCVRPMPVYSIPGFVDRF